MRPIASASSIVRLAVETPYIAPIIPGASGLDGFTMSRLVPSSSKVEVIIFWRPVPKDIKTITAPTPIIIPSMVRAERSLLANSDFIAILKNSINFIISSTPRIREELSG